MSLELYEQKRDFKQTPEPKSAKAKSKKSLKFVVQRHHASHVHYDFRLEIDGVLKSWAIPKGPSLNPKDKRLAMMVEDHPYDYLSFEGEIPKGNYGAGTVYIFDQGIFETIDHTKGKKAEESLLKQLNAGSIKIRLKGEFLQGEFALVKIKNSEQDAWLLIKHNDEFATHKSYDAEKHIPKAVIKSGIDFKKSKDVKQNKSSQFKESTKNTDLSPMLAKSGTELFDDENWIYERKLDGYRIIAVIQNHKVRLLSRNQIDYTQKFATITSQLSTLNVDAVFDGEIVALDKLQNQNFQLLNNYEKQGKDISLEYHVFDLLTFDGHDIKGLSLEKRKKLLAKIFEQVHAKQIILSEYKMGEGQALMNVAKKHNWEGIIAKRLDDEYYTGKRTDSWLKFKLFNSEDAIICGFTQDAEKTNTFGAIVLGQLKDKNEIVYIGNCGSGFSHHNLKELYKEMSNRKVVKKPLSGKVNQEKMVTWIKPELICEVSFTEWTNEGHLRHPVFKGLRKDKSVKDLSLISELTETDLKVDIPNEIEKIYSRNSVKITNIHKVYWPQDLITKGELINYYEEVSDFILPYLKDKPLSLNRHPNGIDGTSFFQKDVDVNHLPKWAKSTKVLSESNNKYIDYLICNNQASLIYMVNLGCIEINPWLSTYKKPDFPEWMVIDLDPDGNKFNEVVEVALVVKEVYDEMGIKSFIKTSGSSGLHIIINLGSKYDYEFIKSFALYIATSVHERIPKLTSLVRSPSKRKGLIYIDYLQNRKGQTIAAPYSVRPKPHATVSMPISWDDVNSNLTMNDFTIKTVPDLLRQSVNPWQDLNKHRIDIKKALERSRR